MAYTFFTSFKKTLNKSSSRCMYRQMNSAKYVEKRCFRTPNLDRFRLCMPPVSFNFIGMITVFVHEFYRVVHCSVFIAMRLEFGVRFLAVRHYNCSRFNPVQSLYGNTYERMYRMYRQMNSAKYVEKRCFRTPNLDRFRLCMPPVSFNLLV